MTNPSTTPTTIEIAKPTMVVQNVRHACSAIGTANSISERTICSGLGNTNSDTSKTAQISCHSRIEAISSPQGAKVSRFFLRATVRPL